MKKKWSSRVPSYIPCILHSPRSASIRLCASHVRISIPCWMHPLVSFGGSEEDVAADDSMSLMASDTEKWACPFVVPVPFPSSQPTQPSVDSELICALTKAVADLGLAWVALEETPSLHHQCSSHQHHPHNEFLRSAWTWLFPL